MQRYAAQQKLLTSIFTQIKEKQTPHFILIESLSDYIHWAERLQSQNSQFFTHP